MVKRRQKVTLRQIAELAHTSKSTVSRVLTNHPNVAEKTRRRVLEVIEKLHFRPNLFARGLAGGRTGLIGVIATEINSGFFAEVLRGIDAVTAQHQGHVLSCFAHGPDDFVALWEEMAGSRRVDGIVLVAPMTNVLQRVIAEDEPPVALCACRASEPKDGWTRVDCAVVDNEGGFAEVMRHLYERGKRRFLYMAGPPSVYDANVRRRAVENFVGAHPDTQLRVIVSEMTREDARIALSRFLAEEGRDFDAVVACNDRMALGAWEVLKERGIRVPDDVAVTGCDDEDVAALAGLTTLKMPMFDLGQHAAQLLFERLAQPEPDLPGRVHLLPLVLQVRESTIGGGS